MLAKIRKNWLIVILLGWLVCLLLLWLWTGYLVLKTETAPVSLSQPPEIIQQPIRPNQPQDESGGGLASERGDYHVVTAYSKWETCPDTTCITASGKIAKVGMVACPRSMAFGTKVKIAGKIYSCEDRTHFRFDGRFDIYMGDMVCDYFKALDWGIRELPVTIY